MRGPTPGNERADAKSGSSKEGRIGAFSAEFCA
jgi:hypothetical protein